MIPDKLNYFFSVLVIRYKHYEILHVMVTNEMHISEIKILTSVTFQR